MSNTNQQTINYNVKTNLVQHEWYSLKDVTDSSREINQYNADTVEFDSGTSNQNEWQIKAYSVLVTYIVQCPVRETFLVAGRMAL
jgi:hypothetical protein